MRAGDVGMQLITNHDRVGYTNALKRFGKNARGRFAEWFECRRAVAEHQFQGAYGSTPGEKLA